MAPSPVKSNSSSKKRKQIKQNPDGDAVEGLDNKKKTYDELEKELFDTKKKLTDTEHKLSKSEEMVDFDWSTVLSAT